MAEIEELKRKLRVLREEYGLSQSDVAALAGMDYKFYQYVESPRKKQVWLETVGRLAAVYGMTSWQLLHPNYRRYARDPDRPKKSCPTRP